MRIFGRRLPNIILLLPAPAVISAGVHALAFVGLVIARPPDPPPPVTTVFVEIRHKEPGKLKPDAPKPKPAEPPKAEPEPEAGVAAPGGRAEQGMATRAAPVAKAGAAAAPAPGRPTPAPEHHPPARAPDPPARYAENAPVPVAVPLSADRGTSSGGLAAGSIAGAGTDSAGATGTRRDGGVTGVSGNGSGEWDTGAAEGNANASRVLSSVFGRMFASDYYGGSGGGTGLNGMGTPTTADTGGGAPVAVNTSPTQNQPQQNYTPDGGVPNSSPDAGNCTMCSPGMCTDITKDIMNCGSCAHACKEEQKCQAGACTGGPNGQYIVDTLTMPNIVSDFAIDLNFDGLVDNQFVHFLDGLTSYGIPLRDNLTKLVLSGQVVFLLDIPPTEEPTEQVKIYHAMPGTPPSQGAVLTADLNYFPALFTGIRTQEKFVANAPPGQTPPELNVVVPSYDPKKWIAIPFRVQHIEIDVLEADGRVEGRLEGSVRKSDLELKTVGPLANYLNDEFAHLPPKVKAGALSLFDYGGHTPDGTCTNPDGTKGAAQNQNIDPCELLLDPGIQRAITPDLQVYLGKPPLQIFMPQKSPAEKDKDSISFGLGFSGFKGKWQ